MRVLEKKVFFLQRCERDDWFSLKGGAGNVETRYSSSLNRDASHKLCFRLVKARLEGEAGTPGGVDAGGEDSSGGGGVVGGGGVAEGVGGAAGQVDVGGGLEGSGQGGEDGAVGGAEGEVGAGGGVDAGGEVADGRHGHGGAEQASEKEGLRKIKQSH